MGDTRMRGAACSLSLIAALLLALSVAPRSARATETSWFGDYVWKRLKIGAGGWTTGLDIAADGTKVIRSDTYGAYIWDAASSEWKQLVTTVSMGATSPVPDENLGVYEIRIAPSNSSRLYMTFRGNVYRSDNRGVGWRLTRLSGLIADANDKFRMNGQKMAIDPVNPDVVLVGSSSTGLWLTTDGGASWNQIVDMLVGHDSGGITGIAFDPRSVIQDGRTQTIYAGSWGHGVWRSTNGGRSWSKLDGGPSTVHNAQIAGSGAYYAADGAAAWKFSGVSWQKIETTRTWHVVVCDPANPNRLILSDDSGTTRQSLDGGATWTGVYFRSYPGRVRTLSPDIPWLEWASDDYLSTGDMRTDSTDGNLYFASGTGVWRTRFPETYRAYDWISQSKGLEQLVANVIVAPAGGKPLVGSWDRAAFRVTDPDAFPSHYGPDNKHAILMGWSMDYASTQPNFIVGIFNWWGRERSSYSTDGGVTWREFASKPEDVSASGRARIGGAIAASTPTNFVWVPSNNSWPYFTMDAGKTWVKADIPDAPTGNQTGWGWAHYLRRQIVAADRVNPGTFYAYNYLKGLYRTTDGGSTWSLIRPGQLGQASGFNAKLKTVPGRAGHVFFTSGPQRDPRTRNETGSALRRSIDGGMTWKTVSTVLAYDYAFGKPKANGYPTIFVVGWMGEVFGIWRSDDDCLSWKQIGNFPLTSLDAIRVIEGDPDIYGRVYVGFGGSGYAYGEIARPR